MQRRDFLKTSTAAICLSGTASGAFAASTFEVTRTNAEWQAMLTSFQYKIMRENGTERAGTSPLDKNYAAGTYHCRGCDLAVYASANKYDSHTGWPSFWQSLPNAVRTMDDHKALRVRTEVHCRRCGSHFGHIFDDGPAPTGKRHCLNGASLVFSAA